MKKLLSILAITAATCALQAENILFWDTFPIQGGVPGPTTLVTAANAAGVQPSTLALGPGITPRATNDAGRFQAENFNANTLSEALQIGDYFEFTLTPQAGKGVNLEQLTIVLRNRGASTEARTIAVVTSADNYVTVVATINMPAGNDPAVSGPKTVPFSGIGTITAATTFRIVAYFPTGFDASRTHPLAIGWPSDSELTTTPALLLTGTVADAAATWYGYTVGAQNWVDTGSWLGWVNITFDPWVWTESLAKYVYLNGDSGWVYVPKP